MRSFTSFSLFIVASWVSISRSLETVPELDITKYAGRWYQVYANRFSLVITEKRGSCITADYSLQPDGTLAILNRELDRSGRPNSISGTASVPDTSFPGRLEVNFAGGPTGAPYWVIDIGPVVENLYDYSVVSDPKGVGLFVLARNLTRFEDQYDARLCDRLQNKGFTLIKTSQDGCPIPERQPQAGSVAA